MIPHIRKAYNENFTEAKYDSLIRELSSPYPGQLDFRVAETPLFIPADFRKKIISACESIVDVIVDEKFEKFTRNAIPHGLEVPGKEGLPHFIAFDFGICLNDIGEYEPQLIEMQGFPSLFCWEVMLEDVYRKHFPPPGGFSPYLSGYDRNSYLALLKNIIVGTEDPDEVILLQIFPHQQKTGVEF